MKKVLLSFLSFIALFFSFTAKAQSGAITSACGIYDILIQNVRAQGTNADGKCVALFDVAFTLSANNGNKFVYFQTYIDTAIQGGVVDPNPPNNYPNYFNCVNGQTRVKRAPNASQAGDPLLNISIDNTGATPIFLDTYAPDPALPIEGRTATSTITTTTLANGDTRFLITDLRIELPYTCESNTQYIFASDVFSSQAANGVTLHCVNCNVRTTAGFIRITGCTTNTTVTANLQNTSSTPQTVTYQLYADNGNGILATENGFDVLLTEQTVTIPVGGSFPINYTIPAAHQGKRIFVVINIGDARRAQLLSNDCIGASPLPVTMKSFTATRNRGNVSLRWTTATETNNRGFNVQRNVRGDWENVVFVASGAAGGNSSSDLSYTYTDANDHRGISQYRIQQVDLNGSAKLSEIRAVRGEEQMGKTLVYPNPSRDGSVSIVFDDAIGTRSVVVSDISGRVIKSWKGIKENNLRITNLTPGTYLLRIVNETGGETVHEKIVVSK